jgi:hypothetical protein
MSITEKFLRTPGPVEVRGRTESPPADWLVLHEGAQ